MYKILIFALFLYFSGCASRSSYIGSYHSEVLPSSSIKEPTKKPYMVNGKVYYPLQSVPVGWTQRGIASWYGPNFHGRYTSNGEVYNMYALTAAHKTLPMNTMVKVTNLNNGKSVVVRVNDRGPFVAGRIIDLSYAAGKRIGLDVTGTAPVKLEVVGFKGKNYVSGYMVQVGAFLRMDGAKKAAYRYQKLGYNTVILKQNGFYKVYIRGFKSYEEARKFKLREGITGFIVGE
ncbi:MAG: septal ring lytic transglycosylase RlpA family protein [Epsilonproteobacteria bacterium]|nr:septal ring lytic transglycosylase RlpA family protein [Campylobacterota bacterium]